MGRLWMASTNWCLEGLINFSSAVIENPLRPSTIPPKSGNGLLTRYNLVLDTRALDFMPRNGIPTLKSCRAK